MDFFKTIKIASALGAISVLIGAFGAHGLEEILSNNSRIETFETAVRYQFYHAIALLIVGLLMRFNESKYLIWAVRFFLLGILVFSGSLYILSLTNYTLLGAVTPLGGLFFILGWLALYQSVQNKTAL
tara:strand:- start:4363 stop:4746 length:384 start_codon:yes stop_codon:yes gene_type:complete